MAKNLNDPKELEVKKEPWVLKSTPHIVTHIFFERHCTAGILSKFKKQLNSCTLIRNIFLEVRAKHMVDNGESFILMVVNSVFSNFYPIRKRACRLTIYHLS